MIRWADAALAHAQAEAPREACGLVVLFKGRYRYHPCRNLATDADQFILDPQDYAQAEQEGEIFAIFHSHPNGPCTPSPADMMACEASGLPWFIVSTQDERWHYMEPEGYRQPLVGREWSHGTLDCYSLIRDWYAKERHVQLPDFNREQDWWLNGQNLYLQNFARAGFREIDQAAMQPGDVILMRMSSPVPNHGAVYLGDNRIIHHLQNRLSSRDTYSDFWRQRTTNVLRHENDHSAG